jgi:hypothetical protein
MCNYVLVNAAGDEVTIAKRILKIQMLFNDRTEVAFMARHSKINIFCVVVSIWFSPPFAVSTCALKEEGT